MQLFAFKFHVLAKGTPPVIRESVSFCFVQLALDTKDQSLEDTSKSLQKLRKTL